MSILDLTLDLSTENEELKKIFRDMINSDLFKKIKTIVPDMMKIINKVVERNNEVNIKCFVDYLFYIYFGKYIDNWSKEFYASLLMFYYIYEIIIEDETTYEERNEYTFFPFNFNLLSLYKRKRMSKLIDKIFKLIDEFYKESIESINIDEIDDKSIVEFGWLMVNSARRQINHAQTKSFVFLIYVLYLRIVLTSTEFFHDFPELDLAKQKAPEGATGGETLHGSPREPNGNKVRQRTMN